MAKVVEVWYELENGRRVVCTKDVIGTVGKLKKRFGLDNWAFTIVEALEQGEYVVYNWNGEEWHGLHTSTHPFRGAGTPAYGRSWYFKTLEDVQKFINEA